MTLLVLDTRPDGNGALWLRVLLPTRPNGSSAWIPANTTELGRTSWRIEISTEERTVTVFHQGSRVRSFPAVVGAPATPTPHGHFALLERIPLPPTGFLGSWALHLTGFSDVLAHFDRGDGQLALHGRGGLSLRDPLGSARSHGCIRIDNAAIGFIASHAPLGTPVLID
jgi:lipoprotein-anchoring transpeptidase ErfK/SrfK